jgi:hypothetical protein
MAAPLLPRDRRRASRDQLLLPPAQPRVLHAGYAIEHAIAEGNEVFDFLRGEHMYKGQLANGTRDARFVAAFRPNARALAYRLRRVHLPAWKARLYGKPVPTIEW